MGPWRWKSLLIGKSPAPTNDVYQGAEEGRIGSHCCFDREEATSGGGGVPFVVQVVKQSHGVGSGR